MAITISDGEIWLNEFPFSTLDYEPPHYPRSIAYEDTTVVSGGTVYPRRSVTDLGPLMGVWKPFKLLCYVNDQYDTVMQPHRGEVMYENILQLTRIVGEPIRLLERLTGKTYNVMFGPEGIDPVFANRGLVDADRVDYGAEYEVSVTFFEVTTD